MSRRFIRFILPATIFWVIVIFILCTLPGEDIPDPHLDIPHLDKVVHWALFGMLALLLMGIGELKTKFQRPMVCILVLLLTFIYGGLIEILQHYFFHRSGDLWDLGADLLGSITGCLSYPLIKRLFFKL